MNGSATIQPQRSLHPAFRDFRDCHAGETVLVCGCGSSLNELADPQCHLTIGVNDVGRLFDPTYLVVVNPRSQFKGERFRYVEESNARALFTQLDLGRVRPTVVRFRLGKYGGTDTGAADVLHYTQNSPYVAICLAAYMGATRIGLIGVDLADHHFFAQTGRHPLVGRLREIDEQYGRLAATLAKRGVELVNLSSISRLTSLPRASLEAFAVSVDAAVHAAEPVPVAARQRRVFFVNYRFLACGDVFATGLAHAAEMLGLEHGAAWWDDAELPAKIRAFAPDLVFVVHGRRCAQQWPSVLREWRSGVWLVDEPYEVDDTERWSSRFGTVFVNDPVTLGRHRNAHPLPMCFDPRLHFDPGGGREHRVGFIGGYNPVRERFLARLAEEGLLSYVVGGPWKTPALQRSQLAEHTTPAETARLYQGTQIVLNVFRSVHHFNRAGIPGTALNPRIFEALACGALVVSEPRPALAASFPELPTFHGEEDLVATVRSLLDEPARLAALLAASRARLASEDYSSRLARALQVALREPSLPTHDPSAGMHGHSIPVRAAVIPAGWEALPPGAAVEASGELILTADARRETGLATVQEFGAVKLSFDVRLDARCRFIAKLHHAVRGDRAADSYHLLAAPERSYVARHNAVLAPVALARNAWQQVEIAWNDGVLTTSINGREAVRCVDAALEVGYCFIGVTGGSAAIRRLRVETPQPAERLVVAGWTVQGTGTLTRAGDDLDLSARPGYEVSLVSEASANDVELEFSVRLSADAHFIAKIHHQSRDDSAANSYHLITTPTLGYLARHNHVFTNVRLARRTWQRVRLRWIDQCLELYVNGRRVVRVGDNLMQSGFCVLGVEGGAVEVRDLAVRDLSALTVVRTTIPATAAPVARGYAIPFTATPRRNLIYHIWPVRGQMWRWNVEQLLSRIDLFNGKRIIGMVHDARSEDPEEVQRLFDGHGCEFMVAPNGPSGEGITFPRMLERVRSIDPNEVTFYAHAKGVKYEPSVPDTVRRWAATQYRVTLDHWPSVREQLERFAMTGSFKMLGRFRAHHHVGDWHYSGTFFWLRHALVFTRNVGSVQSFYGCVEAWPGVHFRSEETGCLFMDDLRQLPYHEEFWSATADAAFKRWQDAHPQPTTPAKLMTPQPFEGFTRPRLEQRPEEFAWLLDQLVAVSARTFLCIGSVHGGVEWHIARRFHELGRDVCITTVDSQARPELQATIADTKRRFGAQIDLVVGDSTAAATRERLAPQYDAVFIDGDHGYRGARYDVEFALTRSPRLVALHNIADSNWHAHAHRCESRLWAELRATYPTEEHVTGEWGGIGIVRPACTVHDNSAMT